MARLSELLELPALPCIVLTPAAGVLGVALDQWAHYGLSTWVSLCRRSAIPYGLALWLQLNLMPFSLCLMLLTALLTTVAALRRHTDAAAARTVLAGHAGCLAATLAMPWLCPPLAGRAPSLLRMLGTMATTELALTALVAVLLLRALAWHQVRRAQPALLTAAT